MINARGQQFSASSLDELKQFAKKGALGGGDIVQPPGASDWLYALEVPELSKLLRMDLVDELDGPPKSQGMSSTTKAILAVGLGVGAVVMWGYTLSAKDNMVTADQLALIGDKGGLSYSEVLVTESGKLHREPNSASAEVGSMTKDQKCGLMAKAGKWYKLKCGESEGYAQIDQVVPAYYFAPADVRKDYDPLYNPDRYVSIANLSWRLPLDSKVTVMSLLIQNSSKYTMEGLKLQATIKDKNSSATQELVVDVEGPIPPKDGAMIGTIMPPKGDKTSQPRIVTAKLYEEELKLDATLSSRWKDGVELALTVSDPEPAPINIVELHAVP
jgi:hypothetical protein